MKRVIPGVLLPGLAWLAMPKCPVCLAGWLSLLTGVGVSAGFAAGLRIVAISMILTALFLFAAGLFRNYKKSKP